MIFKPSELVIYVMFIYFFHRSWSGTGAPPRRGDPHRCSIGTWMESICRYLAVDVPLIMCVFLVCPETTGTEGSEDAFLYTHTHAHTPFHVTLHVDIQYAVLFPPVCLFVFPDPTFVALLLGGSLTRTLLYLHRCTRAASRRGAAARL